MTSSIPIHLSGHFFGLSGKHITRPRLPVRRYTGWGEDMHGAETRKLLSCQDIGCKPAKLQCGVIKHEMGCSRGERGPRGAFEPEKMYKGEAASREVIPASHFFRLHRTTEAVTLTFPKPSCLAQTTPSAQGQHILGRLLQPLGNGPS